MSKNKDKTKNNDFAIDIIICLLIFLLPFIYIDTFGSIFLLSVVALMYIYYPEWKFTEDNLKYTRRDVAWLLIGLLFYVLVFALTALGIIGDGLTINEILLLPSYLALINYAIPVICGIFEKRMLKQYIYIDSNAVIFILLMFIPFSVVSIGNAYFYFQNPTNSNQYHIQMIFQLIVGAAIGEELMYRGFFYTVLKKLTNRHWAMMISALLFSGIHTNIIIPMFNNVNYLNLLNLIVIFFLGIVNCMMYERSKSLVAPIVFHILFNGTLNYVCYLLINIL